MNPQMKATWRNMVGTALLWTAFSTLVYVLSPGDGTRTAMVSVLGFLAFASGLALFADGLTRDIVAHLRQGQSGHAS
ncbi:MAG: hypothetical protein FJY95_13380 [Candidatus Handelsmanbacteria bacterium]|nr:hypothetical protein [Candidatus Handelsmanbacteria bacterium]